MGIINSDLSSVLFSKTQQQVLGLLYGRPDASFYTNEIIRLTAVGNGAVQRELAKLTSAGILTVTQLGNQKRYQANIAMPFFAELRSIILKTFGLADVLKAALEPVRKKIDIAFIYGSIAKQEDTAISDIDLMIITDNLSYAELFSRIEKVEAKLNRKINPTFYSASEWINKQKSENHFVLKILKQPKIFLIGTEDGLSAIRKSSESGPTKG